MQGEASGMIEKTVTLNPFGGKNDDWSVQAWVARDGALLRLVFVIQGKVEKLLLPGADKPSRKDGLWNSTCFECFIKGNESDVYYELNVSPGGDWNFYRFKKYRQGMCEAEDIDYVQFAAQIEDETAEFRCSIPIGRLFQDKDRLILGISCILESSGGDKSYWALAHPEDHPDFHSQLSFTLSL